MAEKIFVNKCIPEYVPSDLKWYERDGLLTCIDQIKYQHFNKDTDSYLKKAKVIIIYYYISLKKTIKFLMLIMSLLFFQRLFDEYKLANEGWHPFEYGIDKCSSWSDYDLELVIYSKKPKY